MDNILDHVVVQGQSYDIVSPTAFGDYIETIGSACINPDGYAKGSTFLAKLGNEQFYYEATAAITQGSAISEGTNCKKTTVTGREAELAADINSLNEALSNDENAIFNVLGAKNLCRPTLKNDSNNTILFTPIANGGMNISGTANGTNSNNVIAAVDFPFTLKAGTYKLTIQTARTDIRVRVLKSSDNSLVAQAYKGDDTEFTLGSDTEVYAGLWFNTSGVAINENVYVMIRPASVADKTYVPYAKSNLELTEELTITKSYTLPSGTYNDTCYFRRIGHVVQVGLGPLKDTLPKSQLIQIAELPKEFRPLINAILQVETPDNQSDAVRYTLTSQGAFNVYRYRGTVGSGNLMNLGGTLTYLAE